MTMTIWASTTLYRSQTDTADSAAQLQVFCSWEDPGRGQSSFPVTITGSHMHAPKL